MKTNTSLYLTIISVFLFNCFAQNKQLKKTINSVKTIKLYHVEERVNMTFGGYITTYTVSDPSLISTYDLGPNNTRVITPLFEKKRKIDSYTENITETVPSDLVSIDPVQQVQQPLPPTNLTVTDTLNRQNGVAYITMIKTFERIAEKGYKSIEMFQKLGNAYYYNSQLDKSAKWYKKLFEMTTNLDPEYYYRYAHSLKAVGERDKADEMLEKYNQLTKNNPK